MSIDDFYKVWQGKNAEFDGGSLWQCKDLFSFYNRDVVGNPNYVYGNAVALYEACPAAYYKKVSIPQKGDVVVWSAKYTRYGHVGIFWERSSNGFVSFDQNAFSNRDICQLVNHHFFSVLGYLRPKIFIKEEKVNLYDDPAWLARHKAAVAALYPKVVLRKAESSAVVKDWAFHNSDIKIVEAAMKCAAWAELSRFKHDALIKIAKLQKR